LSVKTIVKWDNRKFLKDILLREVETFRFELT
jgi:hypothetical protein